ncbi:hypothetical protein AXK61_09455 [Tsukamurella pseudospumae]|nr:hypothetical protein AXK61_09455 [Tsukamurella pseudospumae]
MISAVAPITIATDRSRRGGPDGAAGQVGADGTGADGGVGTGADATVGRGGDGSGFGTTPVTARPVTKGVPADETGPPGANCCGGRGGAIPSRR